MAERSSRESFFACAFAPALPERTFPDGPFNSPVISPVARFTAMMAAPIMSAGGFSRRGPAGIDISLPSFGIDVDSGDRYFFLDICQEWARGRKSYPDCVDRGHKSWRAIAIGK